MLIDLSAACPDLEQLDCPPTCAWVQLQELVWTFAVKKVSMIMSWIYFQVEMHRLVVL